MWDLFTFLLPSNLLKPFLKPVVRLFLGLVAIPLFRLFVRRVVKVQDLDEELERDLEQWFRGSLLLLLATKNMEALIFGWVAEEKTILIMATRLLLAIGVIEGMPDQSLFALIYPGPRPPKFEKGRFFISLVGYIPELFRGLLCQHLNRSSPVFAILAVIYPDTIGWVFYGMAISQYLLIGLITSKDKALNVLKKFDAAVALQREQLEAELTLHSEARRLFAERLQGEHPDGQQYR
ncbi:MAG: DNA topoisomerase I [Planctomycetes bacterium]|nr:DNA topoisomerase I [Planctomycetota bacterium]